MMKVLAFLLTILVIATSVPVKDVKKVPVAEKLNEDLEDSALKDVEEVPVAERLTEDLEDNPASRVGEEMGLAEISAEAIGDRIMEEMNGAKEKFDVALNRIGEEISKDAAEQNEANIGNRK